MFQIKGEMLPGYWPRRPERNPLDLNNLPEDCTRDGKQVLEDTSSSVGYRKKKSGARDGKDECGKVYECRFCTLKFCKSQALGGHMNRHRQERETETLNRARQLVFSKDNIVAQGPHQLGGQPVGHGGYHQTANMGDPTLPFRSVYSPRLFSGSSSTILSPPPPPPPPPPPHSYIYTSPSRAFSYPPPPPPHPMTDYFLGHALSGHPNPNFVGAPQDTNYTCIGAPVGHTFASGGGRGGSSDMGLSGGGGGGGRDMSLHINQEEGLNWGRSYTGTQQHLDPTSINRFQDGF
ncbi:zinc finger protein JAGGED-like [Cornus florida]|uniref:zinc finger protein JAGGED-like n=1 Tax=Cornus florida TaxID=4283 RepID=UPI0028A288E0|nr:zinc finger protein JAGGED-like [Cornus florida]